MFKKCILLGGILSISIIEAKILLFTYSYNRPDFIEIQHKTFKKFLKDEYEFVVFNDARDPHLYRQIKTTCKKLGITCIKIPQEIHDQPYLHRGPGENYHAPATRNSNVVMYSLHNYGFKHDDIVTLFDSDMFLIQDFSIREFMKDYDIAGLPQPRGHVQYLWIGLAFLDMRTMPNKTTIDFNCGKIDGIPVDAGEMTYHYLKNNPSLRVKLFSAFGTDHLPQDSSGLQQYNNDPFLAKWLNKIPRNMELHAENNFLHHYAGSNWCDASADYLTKKAATLNNFIDQLIAVADLNK